ncbi:DUF3876 domain-containing protein [Phocaeicola sp.]
MGNRMKMPTLSRIIAFGFILLPLCTGCNDYSINPEAMLGNWKSSQKRPDLTIGKDSSEYYVIVHHLMADGKECPIRYRIVYCGKSTYIKAESRIIMVYSKKDSTLFLSPGGKYCLSISK